MKFYVMSGDKQFDGPFVNVTEAMDFLIQLCGKWASPEILRSAVITKLENGVMDLAKDDNGSPINGNTIYWKNTVWYGGVIVYEEGNLVNF